MGRPYVVNGTLYFGVYDGVSGYELWKTDGMSAGTVLVSHPNADRALGNCNFYYCPPAVTLVTSLGGIGYFVADDGPHGFELWRTDGTPVGTHLVRDLYPGTADAFTAGAVNSLMHNGTLFFSAHDDVSGSELWTLTQQACP